jgi:hypothetical protein
MNKNDVEKHRDNELKIITQNNKPDIFAQLLN